MKARSSREVRAAWVVIAVFLASVIYGLVLLAAFDPGVQGLDPAELFDRKDDARAFLVADFFFPLLYGLAFPTAAWRFGRWLTGGRPPWWCIAATVALALGGVLDLIENVLLLDAIDNESTDLVDTAHAIATPKLVAGGVGDLLAIVVVIRAALSLRAQEAP
jgi:hypothetical protein